MSYHSTGRSQPTSKSWHGQPLQKCSENDNTYNISITCKINGIAFASSWLNKYYLDGTLDIHKMAIAISFENLYNIPNPKETPE